MDCRFNRDLSRWFDPEITRSNLAKFCLDGQARIDSQPGSNLQADLVESLSAQLFLEDSLRTQTEPGKLDIMPLTCFGLASSAIVLR